MNKWVDCSNMQYAVIEARWTDRPPERFVIAYRDEKSLRDAIAAPGIVAVGFPSRDAAVARIETCSSGAAVWQRIPRRRSVDGDGKYRQTLHSAERGLGIGFDFAEIPRIARRLLQHAVAAAVLIFYSRNATSAAIRAFIGGSF